MTRRTGMTVVGAMLSIGFSVLSLHPVAASVEQLPSETPSDTPITSLIVERLPGRTALAAQSVVEDIVDVEARRGKQLGERFETIVLDEPITVDEAEDGYSAISAALAAATPYDAVLMDMRMPGKDGLASTRELRAKGYSGIVIALTANAYDRDRDDCLAAGMNDFATKPLKIDELVKKIERHRSADGVAGRAPQHTQASVRSQKPAKSDA